MLDFKNYTYIERLYSIIQYQQEVIKRYQEYIETNIHNQITEQDQEQFDLHSFETIHCKRITIPQADIMFKCDASIIREYEMIKAEHPTCSIDAIKYYMEEIERNANSN
jgi:hypothetical protein